MSSKKKHSSAKGVVTESDTQASKPAPHDWMTPVEPGAACGPDLEYDPEFVVLAASTVTKADAQYGDFVGAAEPVNWTDVERDCRRLMMRSKDIRLAVLFTRCRTRLAGAAGLAEGVGLLAAWLAAFPETIHPQLAVDTDRDAALQIRMNALQALTDIDGLLADVREIALTRSSAMRLQVRDVERAFANPRVADALACASVSRQLDELRAQQPGTMSGFSEALASLAALELWCHAHLFAYVPDLTALSRLLRRVATNASDAAAGWTIANSGEFPAHGEVTGSAPATDDVAPTGRADRACAVGRGSCAAEGAPNAVATDRQAALTQIQRARHWFETHEPSSPIPVLLRRAEQFVGKRYADAITAIPIELISQWDREET